ncbi:MAG: hypothetical protein WCA84_00135 [Ignavibacteriaceae bacterium]|jgi:hypothetical protein
MEILIFKTSVTTKEDILKLQPYINDLVQDGKWNFDLDDSDKIFRVETDRDIYSSLILIFHGLGYDIKELEDVVVERA